MTIAGISLASILASLGAPAAVERVIHYVAIAIRAYKKYRAVKAVLSGEQRRLMEELSALKIARGAEPLSDDEKARLKKAAGGDEDRYRNMLSVLTDPDALLPKQPKQ